MKFNQTQAEKILFGKLQEIPIISDYVIEEHNKRGFSGAFCLNNIDHIRFQVIVLERAVPGNVMREIDKFSSTEKYLIIMAPYISQASADLCRNNGVGFCDLSGNCRITIGSLFLSDRGHPNLYPKEDHAKTIFKQSSRTTSAILRELLKDTSVPWKVKDLANAVGCSTGLVSRVRTYLLEQRWAEVSPSGLRITDAGSLLKEWSQTWSIDSGHILRCYTLDPIPVFEEKLVQAVLEKHLEACLTGFSGGVRYAPVVRYTKAHVWVAAEDISCLMGVTGLKEVETGSNVTIYIAESKELFIDSRTIKGVSVVSPVQIYLDCMQLKGRGEEMAEAVFNKEINK